MGNSSLIPMLRLLLCAAGVTAVTSACTFSQLGRTKTNDRVLYTGLVSCDGDITNVWDDYIEWENKIDRENEYNNLERISHTLYIDVRNIPLSNINRFNDLFYIMGEDVTSISVKNVSMERIDPIICRLKATPIIDLSGNGVQKFDLRQTVRPSQLWSAENFNLSHNAIDTLEETENTDSFVQDVLQVLDLSHNIIEIVPKRYFKGINNLRTLDLSHNAIKSLDAESFEGLVNLKTLSLSNNKLTHVGAYAGRLHELKLNFNNLVTLDGVKINTNFTLNKLIPSNDDVKFVGSLLQYTPALSKLDVSHNNISTISKSEFFTFANNLTDIDLAYNNITIVECGTFEGKNITNFNIQGGIANLLKNCNGTM